MTRILPCAPTQYIAYRPMHVASILATGRMGRYDVNGPDSPSYATPLISNCGRRACSRGECAVRFASKSPSRSRSWISVSRRFTGCGCRGAVQVAPAGIGPVALGQAPSPRFLPPLRPGVAGAGGSRLPGWWPLRAFGRRATGAQHQRSSASGLLPKRSSVAQAAGASDVSGEMEHAAVCC